MPTKGQQRAAFEYRSRVSGRLTLRIDTHAFGKRLAGTRGNPLDRSRVTEAFDMGVRAINSLLTAIGDASAQVFQEAGCDDDRHLPVVRDADITWVDRKDGALLEAVRSAACDGGCHFGWVACDSRTTRSVVKVLREDFGIPRKSIKSQAYWVS